MHVRSPLAAILIAVSAFAATSILSPVTASAAATEAAANAPKKRPKVCLVLSGGGARGAAHVGVIKVLEEYRIPIDCIAGTSMGALVGAAYATGMTVEEMEKTLGGISTELLFNERPPRQERATRRKQDDYNVFVGPELGVGDGQVSWTKGIVSGVQLEAVLRQLSKLKGFRKFDELPIPFRAVATDLVTGKAVIFDEGELANVMRASMSVPGAVAPAEFGGMILVDGMLTSNLPVETARAMGADIVIAVNVGTPLLDREQLNGILGVTGQMLSILTEQNVQASLASLKSTDILISPQLGKYTTGDFDHLQKISPLGEEAARKVSERLAALAISPEEYAAMRAGRHVVAEVDRQPIDEIRFDPMQRVNAEAVRSKMNTRAGEPVDQAVLDADMRRIYGMGYFEHVNYRYVEESGKRVLVVDAVEKSGGSDALRFGLGLSSDFRGDSFFNLIGSYRKYWLNSLGGEWRTDMQIGRVNSFLTELYQPVTTSGTLFVAPYGSLQRRPVALFQRDNRVASYDLATRQVGFDVGSELRELGEVRFGVMRGTLRQDLDTGPAIFSPGVSDVAQGGFRARLNLDRVDSVHFPRNGWRGVVNVFSSASGIGADENYTKWDTEWNGAYSFGEHTINAGIKAGGKGGSNPLPRYDMFQWGGFLQQSGYRTGQFYGERLTYGRVMYYQRIMKGTFLEGAYGGVSLEAGKVGSPLVTGNQDGWLQSTSIFVAADSPLGPTYLAYGRARDGNSAFYFFLGRPF